MTTDRITAIREAVTALRKITEQVPNYGMAHAIDLMKDFDLVYANLAYLEALEKEQGINMRVINAAIGVVNADTYVHPMLSRQDAVKAGVAELYDAVSAYQANQPAATIAGCKQEGDGG